MRRIPVVDDDLHVGRAIRIWLEQHGFRVSTADGGPNGLAALDNGTFDLMIIDVFMPQMCGFEAIRLFHERAPTVPLIAVCGHAFAEEDTGAPEFLQLATGGIPNNRIVEAIAFRSGHTWRNGKRWVKVAFDQGY